MSAVGFQPGAEKSLWWKVALHLDETQIALANATAHNVGDPRLLNALYDKLREGQGILLEILAVKGFMPNGTNGAHTGPSPVMSEPAVPEHMIRDAEIIDDGSPPAADAYTEGYGAPVPVEPAPATVGYSVRATNGASAEPVVEMAPASPAPEPSAPEPELPVPSDAPLPQPPAAAEGERPE